MKKKFNKKSKKIFINKKILLVGALMTATLATFSVIAVKKLYSTDELEKDKIIKDKIIKDKEIKLLDKENTIKDNYKKIEMQEQELLSKQNTIDSYFKKIQQQEKLKQEITEKEFLINQKSKIINDQIEEISNKIEIIKEKEKQIENHINDINIKDQRIEQLVEMSKIKEKWIEEKNNLIKYNNIISKILKDEIRNSSDNNKFNEKDKLFLLIQLLEKQNKVLEIIKKEPLKIPRL